MPESADIDVKLKMEPASINDENMTECYKNTGAVMGTAGRNMALNRRPLSDIFHLGMAKAVSVLDVVMRSKMPREQ